MHALRDTEWWPSVLTRVVNEPLSVLAAEFAVSLDALESALAELTGEKAVTESPAWPEIQRRIADGASIRDTARRFATSPRRIRRGLARLGVRVAGMEVGEGGLAELASFVDRLGTVPDAVLAKEAGVIPEAVQGERRRRGIGAFRPRRSAQPRRKVAPPPPPKPRPVVRPKVWQLDDVDTQIVRRKGRLRDGAPEPTPPVTFASQFRVPPPKPMAPGDEPLVTSRRLEAPKSTTRRRIVRTDDDPLTAAVEAHAVSRPSRATGKEEPTRTQSGGLRRRRVAPDDDVVVTPPAAVPAQVTTAPTFASLPPLAPLVSSMSAPSVVREPRSRRLAALREAADATDGRKRGGPVGPPSREVASVVPPRKELVVEPEAVAEVVAPPVAPSRAEAPKAALRAAAPKVVSVESAPPADVVAPPAPAVVSAPTPPAEPVAVEAPVVAPVAEVAPVIEAPVVVQSVPQAIRPVAPLPSANPGSAARRSRTNAVGVVSVVGLPKAAVGLPKTVGAVPATRQPSRARLAALPAPVGPSSKPSVVAPPAPIAVEAASVAPSVVEAPAAVAPAAEAPVVEASAPEAPVVEAAAPEAPVVEAAAPEAPVVEAAAPEAPVVDIRPDVAAIPGVPAALPALAAVAAPVKAARKPRVPRASAPAVAQAAPAIPSSPPKVVASSPPKVVASSAAAVVAGPNVVVSSASLLQLQGRGRLILSTKLQETANGLIAATVPEVWRLKVGGKTLPFIVLADSMMDAIQAVSGHLANDQMRHLSVWSEGPAPVA